MRAIIGVTVLGAALCAASLGAQQRQHGPSERRGSGEGVIEYLSLDEEQQEQWRALHAQHREDMKPLHEQGRILRQRVQESLEADEPEILVGEAAKAAHAHQKSVEASGVAFAAQLSSVLTPEQQEKFEAYKAARGSGRKGRQQRTRRRRASAPSDS
jgi:Spy/CpxP family protein refolding chaperone